MEYRIMRAVSFAGACRLETISNVPDKENLRFGVPFRDKFPAEASLRMSDDFPNDIRLGDAVMNTGPLLVVSARLKDTLEAIPGALFKNEVLPVAIINHKGRREKKDYFVLHQIDHPACLDEKKSTGRRSRLNPEIFQFLDKMVLKDDAIDPQLMIFRAKQFSDVVLVRKALVDQLASGEFLGVEFASIEGFDFLG